MGREEQSVLTELPTPERLAQERLDLATARAAQDEEDEALAIEIQGQEYQADDALDQALQPVTQEVQGYTPERVSIQSSCNPKDFHLYDNF